MLVCKLPKHFGRLGFSATGEAFEEANQDVFDYDYISGKYDGKSSSIFQSLMGLADANYRTAKILSGIDTESELANDPQFWNDVKGGVCIRFVHGGTYDCLSFWIENLQRYDCQFFCKRRSCRSHW